MKLTKKQIKENLPMIMDTIEDYCVAEIKSRPLTCNSKEVYDLVKVRYLAKQTEIFTALYLDAKNRVIEIGDTEGTVSQSIVYPRNIAKRALELGANAVIFIHNHPSGSSKPSANDKQITKQIYFALRLFDIDCLEHIIIGSQGFFSMADAGIIAMIKRTYHKYMNGGEI